MTEQRVQQIYQSIEPLRQQIIHHELYTSVKSLDDLKVFMEYHVFAVWDFMSLLKVLQINLTCTTLPWFPVGDGTTRYLINEIVAGEESDLDHEGNRKSHFELYLEAMQQCGADTTKITTFLEILKQTGDFEQAFEAANVTPAIRDFINTTFEAVNSGKPYVQSAVFTFGREDLIPEMFISIVKDIEQTFPESVSIYKYYLERHIEVDGDHHSHLALDMTSNLCGDSDSNWSEAQHAVKQALQMRIDLWNGALNEIKNRQ